VMVVDELESPPVSELAPEYRLPPPIPPMSQLPSSWPSGGTLTPWDDIQSRWIYSITSPPAYNFETIPWGSPLTRKQGSFNTGPYASLTADLRKTQYGILNVGVATRDASHAAYSSVYALRKVLVKNATTQSRAISFYVRPAQPRIILGGWTNNFKAPGVDPIAFSMKGEIWVYFGNFGPHPAVTSQDEKGATLHTPGNTAVLDWEFSLKRNGHPCFGSPRKWDTARARLCPYLGPRATSTCRNGAQNGAMGKVRGLDGKPATGLPSILYRVQLRGFRERAECAQLGNSRRQARMPRTQRWPPCSQTHSTCSA